MGYDLHITRAEHWVENEGHEISREEWLELVAGDPELSPDPVNGADFALWNGPSRHTDPWFHWSRGNITTKNPDPPMITKMVRMAAGLGATVQGDEGEIYNDPSPR
jgi:hypothetical protein